MMDALVAYSIFALCGLSLISIGLYCIRQSQCIPIDVESSIKNATLYLDELFAANRVPESHGVDHANAVLDHAHFAIVSDALHGKKFTNYQELAIKLAALLHDADDRKYFPKNKNFENARTIIRAVCDQYKNSQLIEELAIRMISYVSTSKNRDSIPEGVIAFPWLLYPRWADRLEAAGWIGVVRAWEYALESGLPLFTDKTPRAKCEDELWAIATRERYDSYIGKSISMIDHYYDKLLHLVPLKTGNVYFDKTSIDRLAPLVFVCLEYGSGQLNDKLFRFANDELLNE